MGSGAGLRDGAQKETGGPSGIGPPSGWSRIVSATMMIQRWVAVEDFAACEAGGATTTGLWALRASLAWPINRRPQALVPGAFLPALLFTPTSGR